MQAADITEALKRTYLMSGLTDEQVAQYVTRLETQIGTKINAEAVAIATGAANSNTN